MEILFLFLAGASVGSFLNVCIYRIPRGAGIARGRSSCPACGERIKNADLVPVVSYMLLKGRCRNCAGRIPARYPAVELATGVIWTMIFVKYGTGLEFAKYAVLSSLMITAAVIDIETGEVYTSLVATGAAAGLLFSINDSGNAADSLLGALLGFAAIAPFALAGGMGWGDADLFMLCGLFLGVYKTGLLLLLSFMTGSAAGICLMALSCKGKGDSIPFGPFIASASVIVILLGDWLLRLYASVIF
jgi:leader peptidase (prepilin peptidase)/N-methyltransferase